ncbi:MAG: MFS transporter [Flavobacteriia bacterium]|nr:MFS transporter [Flavobacteriia bacterium]
MKFSDAMNTDNLSTTTGKDTTMPGARRVLILLSIVNLFNFIDRFVLSSILEPIKEALKIKNDGDMGRLATAFMLGYFITSPIFGYLGDRLSRKKLMAIGVIGWSLGTCLSGVAQVYSFMVFCRIMVGLGEASFGAIGPAVISDAYSSKRRNKAINFFYLAIPIGAALGFAIGRHHCGKSWVACCLFYHRTSRICIGDSVAANEGTGTRSK